MSAADEPSAKRDRDPGAREPRSAELTEAERDAFKRRASALGQKLDSARGVPAQSARVAESAGTTSNGAARGQALGQALKISVDLIAGVAVGGFIGWLLDQQFPSVRPWFLVAFLFLGFAAGMLNVIRTAQRLQRQAEPMQRSAPSVADDRDQT